MTEIKNMSASVYNRLLKLFQIQNKPFAEILQYYGIERFLYRLSKTEHAKKFVLKGGLIFYAMKFSLRRPTRDIDFRGFTENSKENLIKIFRETCIVPVPDDGLVFQENSIVAEDIIPDAMYPGIRVSLIALMVKSQIPIHVAHIPHLKDRENSNYGLESRIS